MEMEDDSSNQYEERYPTWAAGGASIDSSVPVSNSHSEHGPAAQQPPPRDGSDPIPRHLSSPNLKAGPPESPKLPR